MLRGAGELFVNVEEERNRYREVVHAAQLMPSEPGGLSFCDSLVTMEEAEWLLGFNSSTEVNILLT